MSPEEFTAAFNKAMQTTGGDTSWNDDLDEAPDFPEEGEETIAIFKPKRDQPRE